MFKLLDLLGFRSRHSVIGTLELILFTTTAIRRGFAFIYQHEHNGVIRNSLVKQIVASGINSLIPTLLMISIAVAFSITAQLIVTLQSFGSEKEMVNLLIRFVALELSPLLTAIILICRSGSAIAVELGNMKINQETKSLELLGVDIMVYLVFPRLLGMTISQSSLAVYFSILSLILGIFFSVFLESASNFKYFFILIESLEPLELLAFLVKNLLFGLIIGANACFHGLRVQISVIEVSQETQQAIVNSLLMVFLINMLFIL
jgi:phospholipid/cholesterol/gamma-HCH transport system permease protein